MLTYITAPKRRRVSAVTLAQSMNSYADTQNMHEVAPIEPQTVQPQPKPARPKRIPARVAQAVELILTGSVTTHKAAAERVGLNYQHLSKMLNRDYVRVFIERRARQTIASGQMRASARLVELVDAGSEHVSLDATKHLLGISGIAPAPTQSVNVNIELKAGYVIDLSERPPDYETERIAVQTIESTADVQSAEPISTHIAHSEGNPADE